MAELFGRHVCRSVVEVLFQLDVVVYRMRNRFGYLMFVDSMVVGMDRVARATSRVCVDRSNDAFAMAIDHDSPIRID